MAAGLLCLVLLAALASRAMQRCGGHFGYPMDDTYIHMAMAKNFSLHGVWGTTRYGFTSSTSSPLYTMLVAVSYFATGIHEWTPLILNIIAAAALLWWCHFVLLRSGFTARLRFYVLGFLVFAIPLPILILGGMEHVLHTALTLVFVHLCCLALISGSAKSPGWLLLLAGVLVMTRYEGLFVIAAAGVLFLLRGRWPVCLGLALAAAIPICGYGAVSMRHGWFPLPTSLLLKANLPSAPSSGMYPGFLLSLFRNASRGSHVVVLVLIALALLYRSYRKHATVWTYNGVGLTLFAAAALLHLTLARTGWFFRYEAYLVAFGIVSVALAWHDAELPEPRKLTVAALILFAGLITARTVYAFSVAPQAITDIYDQQYQMGLFVRQNLNDRTILINDIGAVSFLSDARVLDLIGLGSVEPARARIHREYSSAWLSRWVADNHAAVAIVYPNLAAPEWQPLATWTIPGNYMSGSDSVNFYSFDPGFRAALLGDLQQFQPQLPARVVVKRVVVKP